LVSGERAAVKLLSSYPCAVSTIIVSFNTRELLQECLQSLLAECARLPVGTTSEVIVVDNASADGSAEMVAKAFSNAPTPVRLLRSNINLGFGAANNLAIEAAQGRYLVLLNSDAFFHPGALARAIEHMDANPQAGIGGARLVGRDGEPQLSARVFHSVLRDALVLSGLASRGFGSEGLSWAETDRPAEVDWVTGAFMILRREALAKTALFDPEFFLYCEEVDLCRRVKAAGYRVLYWPDVVVTHLGGESSRTLSEHIFSESEAQVVLWRMRSMLLYYRKHHGSQAWLARWLEESLYTLRRLRNRFSRSQARRARGREAAMLARLMRQAWHETNGGRISPPRPW
jgi:GT2 family glycosyltransferase